MSNDSGPLCIVKSSPLGGRGLFAIRDVNPGEIIFKERPLLIGPRTGKSDLFCVSCYKTTNSRACSKNCGLPVCCIKCESSSVHSKECRFISSRRLNVGNINLYLFRCLTHIRALLLDCDQQVLLKFFKGHKGLQHGVEVDMIKNNMQITIEEEALLNSICTILDTNSFEVTVGDRKDELSLKGVYVLSSMLNHNCVPNTTRFFDGDQNIILKATAHIPKDSEIFHSYTKLYWGTNVRQSYLLKTKHFSCNCTRCRDPTEFGTHLSALTCCNCKGLVVPEQYNSTWICTNCKTVLPDKSASMVLAILGSRLNGLLAADPVEILQFLDNELVKYAPACNQIGVQLKLRLIWLLGHCRNYYWTNLSEELLNEKEQICRELLQLLKDLKAGSNKMRGLLLYELYSCLKEKRRRITDESNLEDTDLEMKVLLQESQDILKDDVNAPSEIKNCTDLLKD